MIDSNKFPAELSCIDVSDCGKIAEHLTSHFQKILKQLKIDKDLTEQFKSIYIPLAASISVKAKEQPAPLIVGINGAQGSGKSTLCVFLETILQEAFGLRSISLSIDDLYSTQTERILAAKRTHPLLATRGVPGTHDIKLGLRLLDQLCMRKSGHQISIPVFDKSLDDRSPEQNWRLVTTPFDIILFEGWCVGARPQEDVMLASPVNELEAKEDPEGIWRNYVNQRLRDDYAELFARLNLLIMLQVPEMECVREWRSLQENKLAMRQKGTGTNKIMTQAELQRFIMHYERLTLHMLGEMPDYADIVLRINREHLIDGVGVNSSP
jgi:D-glycerate 3-kinase